MDLRVEKTYRSLTSEFMKLLEEKGFEDITVAELCDRAMIRRTTFYKHFADKGEFLVFFVKELRDEFARNVEARTSEQSSVIENCREMMEETLEFLEKHGRLVDNTLASRSASLILDALGDVIYEDILKGLKAKGPSSSDYDEDGQQMLALFVSGGLTRMIRAWCYAGRPDDMKETMTKTLQATESFMLRGPRGPRHEQGRASSTEPLR